MACVGVNSCGCGRQAKWRRWHANIGSSGAQAIKQTKKNQTKQHKKEDRNWCDAEKESKNDLDFGKRTIPNDEILVVRPRVRRGASSTSGWMASGPGPFVPLTTLGIRIRREYQSGVGGWSRHPSFWRGPPPPKTCFQASHSTLGVAGGGYPAHSGTKGCANRVHGPPTAS